MQKGCQVSSLPPHVAIGKSDSFVADVEELVSARKEAVEVIGGRRAHHAPSEFVLRVRVVPQYPRQLKVVASRAGGQWYISLITDQGDILRKYHYQYSTHPNPDQTIVDRSHKHFPTQRYPLRERHKGVETWAYDPGPYPKDFVDAVKFFCDECNITIRALQERLDLRWFR